jgi:hypothetical protein
MTLARHDPDRWMRVLDEKAAHTASSTARAMLATLRTRFLCAYTHDINGFLGTFAPGFERIAYVGGSAQVSSLDDLARLASLRVFSWPEVSCLMVDSGTIAVQGVFNIVLTNDETRQAIGLPAQGESVKHLLSAHAGLFIQFHEGLQTREIAYGGAAPTITRLADDDILSTATGMVESRS